MTPRKRSIWLIVLIVAAVAVALIAYCWGESAKPRGFGGFQLAYVALAVLIPLFVYWLGVGPMAPLGGTPPAGEAAREVAGEAPGEAPGEVGLKAAGAARRAPAMPGMSGKADETDG